MKLRWLALRSLALYALDMGCAVVGFVYGFGLTVKNWPALIGAMIVVRWFGFVARGVHDFHAAKEKR